METPPFHIISMVWKLYKGCLRNKIKRANEKEEWNEMFFFLSFLRWGRRRKNGNVDCKNYTKIIPLGWIWCAFISLKGTWTTNNRLFPKKKAEKKRPCTEEKGRAGKKIEMRIMCKYFSRIIHSTTKHFSAIPLLLPIMHFPLQLYIHKKYIIGETLGNNKMCLVRKKKRNHNGKNDTYEVLFFFRFSKKK